MPTLCTRPLRVVLNLPPGQREIAARVQRAVDLQRQLDGQLREVRRVDFQRAVAGRNAAGLPSCRRERCARAWRRGCRPATTSACSSSAVPSWNVKRKLDGIERRRSRTRAGSRAIPARPVQLLGWSVLPSKRTCNVSSVPSSGRSSLRKSQQRRERQAVQVELHVASAACRCRGD